MPMYIVSLCYSGYLDLEVEAESEDAARNTAEIVVEQLPAIEATHILGSLERWEEADMVSRKA